MQGLERECPNVDQRPAGWLCQHVHVGLLTESLSGSLSSELSSTAASHSQHVWLTDHQMAAPVSQHAVHCNRENLFQIEVTD